jgi:protein associated with RNAse G/E
VYLFDDRWYSVIRARRDGRIEYYANIGTPVEFDGGAFHTIDLDLDISWFTDEPPRVLDEDEFLDHATSMRYPERVIERARSAVDDVLRLIKERAFPFDRT